MLGLQDTSLNAGLGHELSKRKDWEQAGRKALGTADAFMRPHLFCRASIASRLKPRRHQCPPVPRVDELVSGAAAELLRPWVSTQDRSLHRSPTIILVWRYTKIISCCSWFAIGDISVFCASALLFAG